MAKFKPSKGRKNKGPATPPGGVGCVAMMIIGIVLVMVFMYFVLRTGNAN